ncbi:MAG: A/G-specific adenine glycosylase [Myxococcales bacterium]|nr:A/G-specific adenine glycosylase [Myxococcales bacterium]
MELSRPDRLRRRLLAWFRVARRDLPWRRRHDAYSIWVSEVMLQQTRVETVIPYYRRFLAIYPSLRQLADADLSRVLKAWEGLGYYARARNLHRAARQVIDQRAGRIPRRYSDFVRLPGAGEYLAAAVTSIAFGEPRAAVDGNARRVLARLLALEGAVERAPLANTLRAQAQRLLDPRRPGDSNQALMELGALICTPRAPACADCPLAGACQAKRRGLQESIPRRPPRRAPEVRHAAAAIIERRGRWLFVRREERGLLGGLWELPGGFAEWGETPAAACRRHLRERLNLRIETGAPAARVVHDYTHFRLVLTVFRCREIGARARLANGAGRRWVRPRDIDSLACHRAVHRALAQAGCPPAGDKG